MYVCVRAGMRVYARVSTGDLYPCSVPLGAGGTPLRGKKRGVSLPSYWEGASDPCQRGKSWGLRATSASQTECLTSGASSQAFSSGSAAHRALRGGCFRPGQHWGPASGNPE